MSYNLKRKFFISLIFIFSLFAFDCLLSIYAYNQVFYTNYLFQVSFYILLVSIIYFFKSNKFSFIYSIIIIILHSIYIFINLLLFISSNDGCISGYIAVTVSSRFVISTCEIVDSSTVTVTCNSEPPRLSSDVYTPGLYVVSVSVLSCTCSFFCEIAASLSSFDLSPENIYTKRAISNIPKIINIPVYMSSLDFKTIIFVLTDI